MRRTRNIRRGVRRTLMVLGFGGLTAFGASAMAPEARADNIDECIRIVDGLVDTCWGEDPSFWRKVGCSAAGGLGYILCIIAETAREIGQAGPGLAPPLK